MFLRVFLASNVSLIIYIQVPIKYKDLGCPIISIFISIHNIHRALLGLVAIINLLCKRLGFGELKPTKMVIQLADYSTRVPRAMVEDVLIKVVEFTFFVNFILLEPVVVVCPINEVSVVLDQQFLAKSSELINFRHVRMKLTFENMIMELSTFNLQK